MKTGSLNNLPEECTTNSRSYKKNPSAKPIQKQHSYHQTKQQREISQTNTINNINNTLTKSINSNINNSNLFNDINANSNKKTKMENRPASMVINKTSSSRKLRNSTNDIKTVLRGEYSSNKKSLSKNIIGTQETENSFETVKINT